MAVVAWPTRRRLTSFQALLLVCAAATCWAVIDVVEDKDVIDVDDIDPQPQPVPQPHPQRFRYGRTLEAGMDEPMPAQDVPDGPGDQQRMHSSAHGWLKQCVILTMGDCACGFGAPSSMA